LDDNKEELLKLPHLKNSHMRVAVELKALGPDETYTFPDGTVVRGKDIKDPIIRGRKVVVLGDTCGSDLMIPIAMDADVLVHEATNAHLPVSGVNNRHDNYYSLERESVNRGHSTPQMAGKFAKKIRAKRLVLTHFSARYLGTDDDSAMKIMWKIEDQARTAAGELSGDNDVIAAWDTMQLGIPRPK
jgi:ribonuclease Z